jgi:hypothetical protein
MPSPASSSSPPRIRTAPTARRQIRSRVRRPSTRATTSLPKPQPGPPAKKASQPTPTAASPPAICPASFKQSRHAATAQEPAHHGKPNTGAAADQRKPPAAPPDGIAQPEPRPHYTNWSRPISRLV